jgi:hypothetical protein
MSDDLSRAVTLLVGYGLVPAPLTDPSRLATAFDPVRSAELAPRAQALIAETAAIEVDWSALSLAEAGRYVEDTMRARHPELGPDALAALAWKWTYDWR